MLGLYDTIKFGLVSSALIIIALRTAWLFFRHTPMRNNFRSKILTIIALLLVAETVEQSKNLGVMALSGLHPYDDALYLIAALAFLVGIYSQFRETGLLHLDVS